MHALKIQLETLTDEGRHVAAILPMAWLAEMLAEDELYAPSADGRLVVQVVKTEEMVHVHGQAQLSLIATCGRCGGQAQLSSMPAIDVTLVPSEHAPAANADGGLTEEAVGLATYEDNTVDLGQVVHDEVLLDLPMQVLCSQQCKGLCPGCGVNLNQVSCDCAPEFVEGALAGLADIKIVSPGKSSSNER